MENWIFYEYINFKKSQLFPLIVLLSNDAILLEVHCSVTAKKEA